MIHKLSWTRILLIKLTKGIIYQTNLGCVETVMKLGVLGGLRCLGGLEGLGGMGDLEAKRPWMPWRPLSPMRLEGLGGI